MQKFGHLLRGINHETEYDSENVEQYEDTADDHFAADNEADLPTLTLTEPANKKMKLFVSTAVQSSSKKPHYRSTGNIYFSTIKINVSFISLLPHY